MPDSDIDWPVLTATVIQFKCSYKILLLRTTVHCYYYDLKEGQRRKKCLELWTQLPEMLISLAPKTLINVYYNKIRFAELHQNKPQHFWIDWRLVKWYFSKAVMYSAMPGENQNSKTAQMPNVTAEHGGAGVMIWAEHLVVIKLTTNFSVCQSNLQSNVRLSV